MGKFRLRLVEGGRLEVERDRWPSVVPRLRDYGGFRDEGVKPRPGRGRYGARGVKEEGWKVQGGRWKRGLKGEAEGLE